MVFKEANLGRELARATTRVRRLTPAQRAVRREITTLEARAARLEQRMAHTPAKVPMTTLTASATRATMNTDRRNLVNAIKIATCNAERLLARHFFRHYQNPRDWLVFRAVLHLPGSVRFDGARVRVTLRSPDQPRVRRALAAMLDDINRMDARLFGTGPTLRFELAE